MLGVFDGSTAKQPKELNASSVERPDWIKTRPAIAQHYLASRRDMDNTLYYFPNGNFMVLSQNDDMPPQQRSVVVMDDIFCICFGAFDNNADLRNHYGLKRSATEAMIVYAAYKVLRDRAPYPPDQVVKDFKGKFTFILFDSRSSVVFLARDREGGEELHWGTAGDGSLVCCNDEKIIQGVCGRCYTPFPQGCLFLGSNALVSSTNGLISFDHPLHMVKAIEHKEEKGNVRAVVFQVDLYTRINSIPRTGSGDNWEAGPSTTSTTSQEDHMRCG